jgi:hydroxypyruvate isomerase
MSTIQLIDVTHVEAAAQEMARYAESCRRAAKDVPILADLYTAQALSGDMAARYLRTIIERHGRTAAAQVPQQGEA